MLIYHDPAASEWDRSISFIGRRRSIVRAIDMTRIEHMTLYGLHRIPACLDLTSDSELTLLIIMTAEDRFGVVKLL